MMFVSPQVAGIWWNLSAMKHTWKKQSTTERLAFYLMCYSTAINFFRNPHAPITRQLIGLTLLKDTFKQLGLEQLHVHAMGVSSHDRWLTFKREKG
jgi:hypothetical protein